MERTTVSLNAFCFYQRNPNGADLPTWPAYTVPELQYMILEPNLRSGRALRADDVSFWNNFIPNLIEFSSR